MVGRRFQASVRAGLKTAVRLHEGAAGRSALWPRVTPLDSAGGRLRPCQRTAGGHGVAERMRTWTWHGGTRLELGEAPIPRPGPGEALVRLRAAAVCGTDLHILQDRFVDALPPPAVIGHEACFEVLESGPGAGGPRPGDRCALDTVIGCGACPTCLAGDKHLCDRFTEIGISRPGIWQEYSVVPHANLVPIRGDVSDAAITQGELLHCVLGGAERLNVQPGERAVVLGDGAAGL